MLLAAPATPEAPVAAPGEVEVIQQQHVVIHVPNVSVTRATVVIRTRSPAPPPPPPPTSFREKKADNCLKMDRVIGFSVSRGDSVDLVLNDGSRRRAVLDKNCPALGFYSGFYVRPNSDGKMCARRDSIRSRSGRSCGISEFKALVPTR
ncbi:hypothetical protein P1X14_18700 [Sphingomonas sp. AOB5]|uniref:hypothetical protein n=1 Tax=Sphingomonas sp. AOB5 TaxID=3034017 RepID=UPI0023F76FF2|nr:hypothetical protein [Sphingomonas sp. AOB5]MDF7777296.1 hypothetical protein [Sphingomonas sp. AOB5]